MNKLVIRINRQEVVSFLLTLLTVWMSRTVFFGIVNQRVTWIAYGGCIFIALFLVRITVMRFKRTMAKMMVPLALFLVNILVYFGEMNSSNLNAVVGYMIMTLCGAMTAILVEPQLFAKHYIRIIAVYCLISLPCILIANNLPMTMVMLATTSLWSTITKAKAENDWKWIQASYGKYMKIAFLLGVAEFAVIVPLQWIFNFWLGDKTITVNYGIAAIFALSGTVMSLRTILANYSNGLCELKIQTVFMTIGAVVNIPLAYIFSHISGSYISIVLANIISMVPYCIAQMLWCQKYFKARAEQ